MQFSLFVGTLFATLITAIPAPNTETQCLNVRQPDNLKYLVIPFKPANHTHRSSPHARSTPPTPVLTSAALVTWSVSHGVASGPTAQWE
ncbi:hypothetical protein N7456_008486 [Penicillium angulare]|uniref:Uncharacterized protein n=1 Tax=Penicillium angulare TaxID=116970 RepID=A0A9W9FCW0_9EURO|nr:hypothetical protein N7456_008486 [Penicillium angulare]